MGEKYTGTAFKGNAGLLKDSAWLTAESLPSDRDTVVQIDPHEGVQHYENITLGGGTKKDKKAHYGALRFVGKEKELGLNSTNLKVLIALFGKETAKWYGQHVALHVEKVIKPPAAGKVASNGDGAREPGSEE